MTNLPKELTEEQKVAAVVTYLFAVLMFDPKSKKPNDDFWYGYCTNRYCAFKNQGSFDAAIWWALRGEDEVDGGTSGSWLKYLAYVCRYKGILARRNESDPES
jgi:hypothetical protein